MTPASSLASSAAAKDYFATDITPLGFDQWLQHIEQRSAQQQRGWLSGHHNLHSLYLLHRHPEVAHFYQRCNDCYLDGSPLRLILAGMGIRTSGAQRFSLMDRFEDLLAHAAHKRWRVYYLGSSPAVVSAAREKLQREYPGLHIELQAGYNVNDDTVTNAINTLRPDLLLVGMGMPKQEQWLNQHLDSLDVGTAMQAGATLDYFIGAQARPPAWVGRIGMAWLYRLVHDPVRLWQRYLLEPWSLLLPTLRLWRGHRRGQ